MVYYIVEKRKEHSVIDIANCYLSESIDKIKDWINNNKDFDTRDNFWYWAVLKIITDDEFGAEIFTYFDWDGKESENVPKKQIEDVFKCFSDEKFIFNVCLSYRHDFGLLSKDEQNVLIFECKGWIRAIKNNYKT
jgi:hypothetical protein